MGKKRDFSETEKEGSVETHADAPVEISTAGKPANTPTNDVTSTTPKKAKKPLPPGYVCKACGMVDDHAIYDCKNKIKKEKPRKIPDEEQKLMGVDASATSTGVSSDVVKPQGATDAASSSKVSPVPSSLIVFISGLPFGIKRNQVISIFQDKIMGQSLQGRDVKLIMFEDKPTKCKGLAYVTFASQEEYAQALTLNKTVLGERKLEIVPARPAVPTGSQQGSAAAAGKKGKNKFQGTDMERIRRCYRCGELHDAQECTNKRVCYRCRSTEHLSKDCPMKHQQQKKTATTTTTT